MRDLILQLSKKFDLFNKADPELGHACIIDVDGLVVPGKYPPDVVGTPDFIAPEVVKTSHLPKRRSPPRIAEYRYRPACTFGAHLHVSSFPAPVTGGKIHDIDDEVRMRRFPWESGHFYRTPD